jgi:hypothetical protein
MSTVLRLSIGMVNIFRFHIRVTVGRVGIDCIGYLTTHAMKLSQNQLVRVIAIVCELSVKFRLYYTVPHITSNSMMCHHSGAVEDFFTAPGFWEWARHACPRWVLKHLPRVNSTTTTWTTKHYRTNVTTNVYIGDKRGSHSTERHGWVESTHYYNSESKGNKKVEKRKTDGMWYIPKSNDW